MTTTLFILAVGDNALIFDDETLESTNTDSLAHFDVPKFLLSIGEKPALTWLWERLNRINVWDTKYIITDARNYKAVERWVLQMDLGLDRILNTGGTGSDVNGEGIQEALTLIMNLKVTEKESTSGFTLISASYLPDPASIIYPKFESMFVNAKHSSQTNSLCLLDDHLQTHTNLNGIPIIIKFSADGCATIKRFLDDDAAYHNDNIGKNFYSELLQRLNSTGNLTVTICPQHTIDESWIWSCSNTSSKTYFTTWKHRVPEYISDDEDDQYETTRTTPPKSAPAILHSTQPVKCKAFARVGLIGNPSDGFYGRTISLLISNFWAEVTLIPNLKRDDERVILCPNPLCDPWEFASLNSASRVCGRDGYYGVTRLFLAAMKVFVGFCEEHKLGLRRQGFKVLSNTTIPRQVGLAGSSALISAFLRALLQFHGLENHELFPPYMRANLALSAEKDELNIAAGQQDRVVQAYGGLVFMDFAKELFDSRGYGEYVKMDVGLVPKDMWLAYVAQPSDSGSIHNDVRSRFLNRDPEVIDGMARLGDLASLGRDALLTGDRTTFADLMDDNLAIRRSLYGEHVIGDANARLVAIARSFGHAAKFSGSGGCIIGLWKGEIDDPERLPKTRRMIQALQNEGYVFQFIKPIDPYA
ncbi:hypothetical protein HDU76_001130 [Blyttiomyces sp. JEL0837]|nr:hypothetical protein HDU76_001130 [Blyttiomyces sp. JEL0837]